MLLLGGTCLSSYDRDYQNIPFKCQQQVGNSYEVINCAVLDYATDQVADLCRELVEQYQPDTIGYMFNLNHPRRTVIFTKQVNR